MPRVRRLILVTLTALLCACDSGTTSTTPTPTPDLSHRPSSAVKITIVSPKDGEVIQGKTAHVVVAIEGGTVVQTTSTDPDPTKGHVHVFLQGQLILMSYTLVQDIPVQPGLTYVMRAEWVGSDHFPFNPRDVTPDITFHVAGG